MDKAQVIRRLSQIKKVEDVAATPPGVAAEASDAEQLFGKLDHASNAMADLRALQEDGWTFGATEQAADEETFEVVVDADGHLKLSGRALTVKIAPELDKTAVNALIERFGLRLRRELGFSPNTFLLEVKEGSALTQAKALNDLSEVLYAEPNLVEPIQSR